MTEENIKIEKLKNEIYGKDEYIKMLEKRNDELKKDLRTLWYVCWNNDNEMTSYQMEVFDNYYDIFYKNGDNYEKE